MDFNTLLRHLASKVKKGIYNNDLGHWRNVDIAPLIAPFFQTLRQWPKLTEKTASDFGYSCFICYSADDAIDKIKGYYNLSN